MVVAAKSRAQTNHRTLDLSGAEVVNPSWAKLAVLVDMRVKGSGQLCTEVISREACELSIVAEGVGLSRKRPLSGIFDVPERSDWLCVGGGRRRVGIRLVKSS